MRLLRYKILGTMIFTHRDIVWPWSNPSTARVSVDWERDTGPFRIARQENRPDFTQPIRRDPSDRGQTYGTAGLRVDTLDRPATPTGPNPGMRGLVIRVRHAIACPTLAVLPVLALLRWRRDRRRFAHGLCQRCGYDLRATPDRCPECGTAARANP